VGFFYGCMVDYVYPEIGESIVKLLNRSGYGVELPEQGCCGAPTLYTGMETTTKKIVKDNLAHFEGVVGNYDHVVTPCPTCTHVLGSHWEGPVGEKAVDFIKLIHMLWRAGKFEVKGPGKDVVVTYHYSCHLKRSCGVDVEPRELLSSVPGVRWVEMEEADRCCGFAGTYSMKLPEISSELLERKIRNIEKSGAEIVLTDCPGCLLSLRNGLKKANSNIQAHHTAVFLERHASGGQGLFLKKPPLDPAKTFV